MLTQEQFIRNYSVMANGEVDFFLGAGASIASGIPTGGDLIWEFKRTLYCSECGVSTEKYKDLALPSTRKLLQEYFDRKGTCPQQYARKNTHSILNSVIPIQWPEKGSLRVWFLGESLLLGIFVWRKQLCMERSRIFGRPILIHCLKMRFTASIRSTMFWYAAKQTVIAFIC